MSVFKDAGHLFRFAGLFVLAFLIFLVVRHYVVPKSFGQYGHYRAAALGEIAAHPAKFAGHETCEGCHSDVADKKSKGKHAHVNCEACHGALFQPLPVTGQPKPNLYERFVALIVPPAPPDPLLLRHAEDPTSVKPVLPDTTVLCARCHTASTAKPKGFPQVVPADHSNGMPCDTCHQPHSPGMDAAAAPDATAKAAGGVK
ncbi:MAG: multiheme c-type cytochrome [Terracidiphilus sp.]|jgi:Cytochrome c554 and c-prime|nr:multiheme c-type cytochrome [Terracidiphilus sp.]